MIVYHEKADLINEIKRLKGEGFTNKQIGKLVDLTAHQVWLYWSYHRDNEVLPYGNSSRRVSTIHPLKALKVTPEMKAQFIEDYSRNWRHYRHD